MISKIATNSSKFKRVFTKTNSAREAWSNIIEEYKITNPKGKIILPAYIGWSPNEGSGIFDSVVKSGLEFDFYGLGLHLEIDIDDLKKKVLKDENQLVLLVHYFGFMDARYDEIAKWLEENNIFFVEDCAHAWVTDLIGGVCGRRGLFSFYSLHKLLPVVTGGIMVNNTSDGIKINQINPFFELNYDLFSISAIRRSNYNYLVTRLLAVEGVEVIYKNLEEGICPQTLPVIVKNYDRTTLYNKMNEAGFGMVSLYHTMIDNLKDSPYEAPTVLAKKIINFPIHQDVEKKDMDAMVDELIRILNA